MGWVPNCCKSTPSPMLFYSKRGNSLIVLRQTVGLHKCKCMLEKDKASDRRKLFSLGAECQLPVHADSAIVLMSYEVLQSQVTFQKNVYLAFTYFHFRPQTLPFVVGSEVSRKWKHGIFLGSLLKGLRKCRYAVNMTFS